MGSPASEGSHDEAVAVLQAVKQQQQQPRILCLHGMRTSGAIMRKQLKWPESVLGRVDLFFADAPFPAEGKSDVEGHYPPPYYEWFQFDEAFMEYRNFDECLAFIEELMIEHGPFNGLMGFSQGGILTAALPGLQMKGLALTRVPKIQFVIVIGGANFLSPVMAERAYPAHMLDCPSLHLIGDMDVLKSRGEVLLSSYVDPLVIRHPKGHIVPKLDEKGLETMALFLEKIETVITTHPQALHHECDHKESAAEKSI